MSVFGRKRPSHLTRCLAYDSERAYESETHGSTESRAEVPVQVIVTRKDVYGSSLQASLLAFFAIARLIEERRNRPFLLIADEQRSFFHLAPRADANPGKHTQLSLHFRATNNRGGPLLLSKARLVRPRPWGAKVQIQLAIHNAMSGTYSSEHFIHARSTALATAQIMLHRDFGDKKKLTFVLEVSDQRGSKQWVKFNGLERT